MRARDGADPREVLVRVRSVRLDEGPLTRRDTVDEALEEVGARHDEDEQNREDNPHVDVENAAERRLVVVRLAQAHDAKGDEDAGDRRPYRHLAREGVVDDATEVRVDAERAEANTSGDDDKVGGVEQVAPARLPVHGGAGELKEGEVEAAAQYVFDAAQDAGDIAEARAENVALALTGSLVLLAPSVPLAAAALLAVDVEVVNGGVGDGEVHPAEVFAPRDHRVALRAAEEARADVPAAADEQKDGGDADDGAPDEPDKPEGGLAVENPRRVLHVAERRRFGAVEGAREAGDVHLPPRRVASVPRCAEEAVNPELQVVLRVAVGAVAQAVPEKAGRKRKRSAGRKWREGEQTA